MDRALEEGVHIYMETLPVQIISDMNGDVTGFEYCRLEEDAEGPSEHKRKKTIKGSHTLLNADLIITAYERKPDLTGILEGRGRRSMAFKLPAKKPWMPRDSASWQPHRTSLLPGICTRAAQQ